MARGTTLTVLTDMVKAEIGSCLTAGVASAEEAAIKVLLSNKQKWLAAQHDWPVLDVVKTVSLTAGTRYYALPSGLNTERPIVVTVLWDQFFEPVEYGITDSHYNYTNSESGDRGDPVERWQYYDDANVTKLEVWPMPSVAQTLRMQGQRTLRALSTGTDVADLDDLLLVLFVSAELLARRKQADAQAKLALAQAHFNRLKGSCGRRGSTGMFIMGGGQEQRPTSLTDRPTVAVTRS